MKKYLFLAICACLSFAGCTDTDEFSTAKQHEITIRASVEEPNDTRANFVKETGKFFWTNNDRISVYTTNDKFETLWIKEGMGTEYCTFYTVASGETTKCAIYPDYGGDSSISGNTLSLKINDYIEYNYSNEDYPTEAAAEFNSAQMPMLAKITENGQENLNFKHLGGAIAIKLTDIPANTDRLLFESKTKKITGIFSVDLTINNPTIKVEGTNDISERQFYIQCPKSTTTFSLAFYIPLPCGEIDGFRIMLINDDVHNLTPIIDYSKTITIERATVYYFPELSCNYTEEIAVKEKQALMALYNATSGVNWKNNANWGSDRPLNEWYGVATNSLGFVTDIALDDNNLNGSLPDNFGDLTYLERLYLMYNPSLTSLNSSISKLTKLQLLYLTKSGITSIPAYLGNIKSLKDLSLSFCDLSGSTIPEEIYTLSNLQKLDLYKTGIGGTISESIGNLKNLEGLNLAFNNLTGEIPSSIGNLTKLTGLHLNNNQLTGTIPSTFENLTEMSILNLSNNKLTGDIPSGIWSLPNLTEINLYGNNFNPIAPQSTDYTHEGEVVTLQKADSKYTGIDIVFLGSAFLDTDVNDGTYVEKMTWAMNSLFSYEPYKSLRDRFNVYTVKAISANNMFYDGSSLAFNESDDKKERTMEGYATKVPGVSADNVYICLVVNTNYAIGRSMTSMDYSSFTETSTALLFEPDANVLVHELGGHAIGKLDDEYVEPGNEGVSVTNPTFYDNCHSHGWSMNVDYHSDASTVLWKDFIETDYPEVGIYQGAGTIGLGLYRPTENSMMRYTDSPFNAPSRYAIYKRIIKASENRECTFDEFVAFDKAHQDVVTRTKAPLLPESERAREHSKHHHSPVIKLEGWRER